MADLIPEPCNTWSGEPVLPRKPGENRPPVRHLDELGLLDHGTFEKAWVRTLTPEDLDGAACEDPSDRCGHDCGCWMICDRRDPRRVQPVWIER